MWSIARDNPNSLDDLSRINGIGPQRLNLHGEDILGELTEAKNAPAPESA